MKWSIRSHNIEIVVSLELVNQLKQDQNCGITGSIKLDCIKLYREVVVSMKHLISEHKIVGINIGITGPNIVIPGFVYHDITLGVDNSVRPRGKKSCWVYPWEFSYFTTEKILQ